jgi:nicotinamide phosphoribosyltransferase
MRIVFYGIRYIIENYVCRQWTLKDVEMTRHFFSSHNANFTPFPFPEELFYKVSGIPFRVG